MKNLVLFGIFVLFLVAVQFASGQSVEEIIEKHIRQRGGFDNLNAIQCIYMEGIISMMGNTETLVFYKEKNVLNPSGFNTFWHIAANGDHSIAADNYLLQTKIIDGFIGEMQTAAEILYHLTDYAGKEYSAVLIGKEAIDGNNCHHIRLTKMSGNEINYWISLSNGLVLQSLIKKGSADINVGENPAGLQTRYNKYQQVDGIMFANNIVMISLEENEMIEINFNKVQINKPIETSFLNQYKQP